MAWRATWGLEPRTAAYAHRMPLIMKAAIMTAVIAIACAIMALFRYSVFTHVPLTSKPRASITVAIPSRLRINTSYPPTRKPSHPLSMLAERTRRVRLNRPVFGALTLPPLTVFIPDQPLSVAVQVAQGEDAGREG